MECVVLAAQELALAPSFVVVSFVRSWQYQCYPLFLAFVIHCEYWHTRVEVAGAKKFVGLPRSSFLVTRSGNKLSMFTLSKAASTSASVARN